jgi:nucleoside diphosphate kinase
MGVIGKTRETSHSALHSVTVKMEYINEADLWEFYSTDEEKSFWRTFYVFVSLLLIALALIFAGWFVAFNILNSQ